MTCLYNTMLFFIHTGVARSTEDMNDHDNEYQSRQDTEKHLQDIEHFIDTCPFLITIPINDRRNGVCAHNAMDSIVLLEAISAYRKETHIAIRKNSHNHHLCKARAKSEGHIHIQMQNTEIECPPKCKRNSIIKNPWRKIQQKTVKSIAIIQCKERSDANLCYFKYHRNQINPTLYILPMPENSVT